MGLLSAAVRRGFSVNNDSKDEKQTVVSFFFLLEERIRLFHARVSIDFIVVSPVGLPDFSCHMLLFQLLIFSRFFLSLEVLKID